MGTRPSTAFVLSLVGGIIVLIHGLLGVFDVRIWGVSATIIVRIGLRFGIVYAIIGGIIILASFGIYARPGLSRRLGPIIAMLGLLSLPTIEGGLLSVVGGILSFYWKQNDAKRAAATSPLMPVSKTTISG